MEIANRQEATLVLFTNFFPYHRGEEYLFSEFPHLYKSFGRIVIVPVMYEAGMEQSFQLPADVEIIIPSLPTGILSKTHYTLKNLPRIIREHRLPLFKETGYRPDRIAYEAYFLARSLEIWDQVVNPLKAALSDAHLLTVYSYRLYVTAYVAVELARQPWAKVSNLISRGHRYDILESRSVLGYLPQRQYMLSHLDRVYTVEEQGRAEIVKSYPRFADRVEVQHLGVEDNDPQFRSSLATVHFVSVSTFQPVKRVGFIAQSMRELISRGHDIRWTHVGAGGNGREEAKVKRLIHELDFPDGTVDLKGYMPNQALLGWMAEAEISYFINLSTSEGVPVSIMEAMASAIPVIATEVGGAGEIVTDGITGFLVDPVAGLEEVTAIFERALSVSSNDYHAMSLAAKKEWRKDWNAEIQYGNFAIKLLQIDRR